MAVGKEENKKISIKNTPAAGDPVKITCLAEHYRGVEKWKREKMCVFYYIEFGDYAKNN